MSGESLPEGSHAGRGSDLAHCALTGYRPTVPFARLGVCARTHEGDAVNREAQIATMLTVAFAFAFLGWAIVYLASTPAPHKDDANRTRFRRWFAAATHRLLKAR